MVIKKMSPPAKDKDKEVFVDKELRGERISYKLDFLVIDAQLHFS